MRKITIETNLSIGYANGNRTEEIGFTVDDDSTDEEIAGKAFAVLAEWVSGYVNAGYKIISDEKTED